MSSLIPEDVMRQLEEDAKKKQEEKNNVIIDSDALIEDMLQAGTDPAIIDEIIKDRQVKQQQIEHYKEEHKKQTEYACKVVGEQKEGDLIKIEMDKTEMYEKYPQFFIKTDMLRLDIKIRDKGFKALVDTGACETIMSLSCAKKLGLARYIDTKMNKIYAGVGEQRSLGKLYNIDVIIDKYLITCNFTIMETFGDDVLIGLDTMKSHGILLDMRNNCMIMPSLEGDKHIVKFI